MQTEHMVHAHTGQQPKMGRGMKVMGIMMGLCLGGTVLAATTDALGIALALPTTILVGVAFAAASLRYHRLMGGLMAVCCGAAVLLAVAPGAGVTVGLAIAAIVATIVGFGSQKLMAGMH
jgi:hypothetical protein